MRKVLLLFCLAFPFFSFSQTFIKTPGSFPTFYEGMNRCADLDNDGDLDIVCLGLDKDSKSSSKYRLLIYLNKGNNFFESTIGSSASKFDLIDFDADGDLDIFLNTRIGINNGKGGFDFRSINVNGVNPAGGALSWGDIDNDNDMDVIVAGSGTTTKFTKIFINQGNESFFELKTLSLPVIYDADVKWVDYDNDGDLDLSIAGNNLNNAYITEIYTNKGNYKFEKLAINLPGVKYPVLSWEDYDKDNDLDLLLMGMNYACDAVTILYKNTNGVLAPVPIDFFPLFYGSASWGDFNNDGKLDVMLVGAPAVNYNSLVILYINQGNDKFEEYWDDNLPQWIYFGYGSFGDFDGDKDLDIFLQKGSGPCIYDNLTIKSSVPPVVSNFSPVEGAPGTKVTLKGDKFVKVSSVKVNGLDVSFIPLDSATLVFTVPDSSATGKITVETDGGIASSLQSFRVINLNTPLNLGTALISSSSVQLKWNDNNTEEEGFLIERSSLPNADYKLIDTVAANISSYIDDNLPLGMIYYYRVRAYANNALSEYSMITKVFAAYDAHLMVNGNISTCDRLITSPHVTKSGAQTITMVLSPQDAGKKAKLRFLYINADATNPLKIYDGSSSSAKLIGNYAGPGIPSDIIATNPLGTLTLQTYNYSIKEVPGWVAEASCTVLPTAPSGLTASYIGDSTIELNWKDNSSNEQGFLIERSQNAYSDFTPIAILDSNTTIFQDKKLTSGTYYYRVCSYYKSIKSSFSSVFNASIPSTDVLMKHGVVITTCTSTFKDSGGDWYYGNNEGRRITFLPGDLNKKIGIIFKSFETEYKYDFLSIYEGVSDSIKLLGRYSGKTNIPFIKSNATSGALTFIFSSDISGYYPGWEAMIFCVSENESLPIVNSLSPDSVASSGAKLLIKGKNFANTLAVQIGGGSAYSFKIISDSLIEAIVPYNYSYLKEKVNVITKAGIGSSLNDFRIYTSNPMISSFSPSSGKPGAEITIYGSDFNAIRSVSIGGVGSTDFKVVNLSEIKLIVPATAQTGKIWVNEFLSNTEFTVDPTPTFTDVSPLSQFKGCYEGNVAWGDFDNDNDLDIAITGMDENKLPISKIYRNDNGVFIDINLAALLPTSFGTIDWVDYDNDGDLDIFHTGSVSANYYVSRIYRNTLGSFESITLDFPGVSNSATAWGDFDKDGDQDLFLMGKMINGQITSGLYENNHGSFTKHSSGFDLLKSQKVKWVDYDNDGDPDLVSPKNVYVNNQGSFTGTNFTSGFENWGDYDNDGDQDYLSFKYSNVNKPVIEIFNNLNGQYNNIGAAGLAGVNYNSAQWGDYDKDGDIDLLLSGSDNSSSDPLHLVTKVFRNNTINTQDSPPSIAKILPLRGSEGSIVTIKGTGFIGTFSVSFNGEKANFEVVSNNEIRTFAPSINSGKITVRTLGGVATSEEEFLKTPTPVSITSFSPTSCVIETWVDTYVKLKGKSLMDVKKVLFNGVPAQFSISYNEISAKVPYGTSTGKISVLSLTDTAVSTDIFTIIPSRPHITSFTPTSGAPGTLVKIKGIHFNGATSIKFNKISSEFNILSDSVIIAKVPRGATTEDMLIYAPAGTSIAGKLFTVLPFEPVISGFTPTSGKSGTSVTLTGKNFMDITSIKFNGITATFTVLNNDQIIAKVPVGAFSGLITVTNAGGTSTSVEPFTESLYSPAITSLSPLSDLVGGIITLKGANLDKITSVKFNGTTAIFNIINSSQINATVPMGATKGKITISSSEGAATSAEIFTVIPFPPVITTFIPSSGIVGTSVDIQGKNFLLITSVKFNAINVAFTINNDSLITVKVPYGTSTGKIDVASLGGVASSLNSFIVLPSKPDIRSFTPTGGNVGWDIAIDGIYFKGTTSVKFNGTPASFRVTSDYSIETSVPAGATSGYITVTSPGGTDSSSSFSVYPSDPPMFNSFFPKSGFAGTEITIKGKNFLELRWVRFGDVYAKFTVKNDSQITAIVPSGITQEYIVIENRRGMVSSKEPFKVITSSPVISNFSPPSGLHGDSVTLKGKSLTGTTSVKFNGTLAVFTLANDSIITAIVPMNGSTGKLTITTPGGEMTTTNIFTVLPSPPAITNFYPSYGSIGTIVSIKGRSLGRVTSVKFNNTIAAFTLTNDTLITTSVPLGATTERITVISNEGATVSKDTFFISLPFPSITNFTPSNGKAGTVVNLRGSGFTGTKSVEFNNISAMFNVVSDSVIQAIVPYWATSGSVEVTNTTGGSLSKDIFVVNNLKPIIKSFTPLNGKPGAVITIKGTNFTETKTVRFNITDASFSIINDSTIQAILPPTATKGKVTIIALGGTAISTDIFTPDIYAPVISSFDPLVGSVGNFVTLKGSSFIGVTTVKFNGIAAYITPKSDSIIIVGVPVGATTGKVTATGPGGTGASINSFTVNLIPPVIRNFTPASDFPGMHVSLNGLNFTSTTSVKFNDIEASFEVYNDTLIHTIIPLEASTGKITITSSGGTSASNSSFTVIPFTPYITNFTPLSGSIGALISIKGENLKKTTSLRFNGTVASFTIANDSMITAVVPLNATSGKISLTTDGGVATSINSFTVSDFIPSIYSFAPLSGTAGAVVNLKGKNFTRTISVKFKETIASFVVVNDSTITATVPSGASTGNVVVSTFEGIVESKNAFTVIPPPPFITSLTPLSGTVGTSITVIGRNFLGATSVKFNGIEVGSLIGDNSMILTVPQGASTGKITIVTPGGVTTSTGSFAVVPFSPVISSFSPMKGSIGTIVTLKGKNFNNVTSVKFNNNTSSFTISNDSIIVASVPQATVTGKITVTASGGSSISSQNFEIISPNFVQRIDYFTPAQGKIGEKVYIKVVNFTEVSSVKINNIDAKFSLINPSYISVIIPEMATTGKITVSNAIGAAISSSDFVIVKTLNAPGNLSVHTSDSLLILSWKDNSDDEIGFAIEKFLDNANGFICIDSVDVNVTTYKDKNIKDNKDQYYRLYAFNKYGKSPYSEVISGHIATVTAVDEVEKEEIEIYPNPSKGVFKVKIERRENQEIKVVDMLGNQVFELKKRANQVEVEQIIIDLSQNSKGIYILKIEEGNNIYSRKLIRE